jgi:hypothetical protein
MANATHLHQLRVVENEAIRQKRDLATDAGHIAYDVIRCVAHSEDLLGDRMKRLVSRTLNFDQSDTSLEQRRARLRVDLRLGEDAYEDFEERAFQQLAGLLLSIDVSPCGPDQPPTTLAAIEAKWRAMGDFEATRLLQLGLARLMLTRNHEAAVEEAGRILESIPLGAEFVKDDLGVGHTDPRLHVLDLLRAVLDSVYDTWVVAIGIHPREVLGARELNVLIDAVGQENGHDPALWRGLETSEDVERLVEPVLQPSLLVLAKLLSELEAKDAWETLRPGGSASWQVLFPNSPIPAS